MFCSCRQDLIKRYLFPLKKDNAQEERVTMELLELRDRVSFAYFLLNACFVVVIFTLQANVESISVVWPCGQNLRLEPIGFMFLIFFGIMMVLQTIGMIAHRTGTFLHIVATTELNFFRKKDDESPSENVKNALDLARNMVRLQDDVDDRASVISVPPMVDSDAGGETISRSQTVKKISRQQTRKKTIADNLDDAFQQRLQQLNSELQNEERSAEDIGTKVIGRHKQTGKSVRAIKTMRKHRRPDGSRKPSAFEASDFSARARCESIGLPEETEAQTYSEIEAPEPTTQDVTFRMEPPVSEDKGSGPESVQSQL